MPTIVRWISGAEPDTATRAGSTSEGSGATPMRSTSTVNGRVRSSGASSAHRRVGPAGQQVVEQADPARDLGRLRLTRQLQAVGRVLQHGPTRGAVHDDLAPDEVLTAQRDRHDDRRRVAQAHPQARRVVDLDRAHAVALDLDRHEVAAAAPAAVWATTSACITAWASGLTSAPSSTRRPASRRRPAQGLRCSTRPSVATTRPRPRP